MGPRQQLRALGFRLQPPRTTVVYRGIHVGIPKISEGLAAGGQSVEIPWFSPGSATSASHRRSAALRGLPRPGERDGPGRESVRIHHAGHSSRRVWASVMPASAGPDDSVTVAVDQAATVTVGQDGPSRRSDRHPGVGSVVSHPAALWVIHGLAMTLRIYRPRPCSTERGQRSTSSDSLADAGRDCEAWARQLPQTANRWCSRSSSRLGDTGTARRPRTVAVSRVRWRLSTLTTERVEATQCRRCPAGRQQGHVWPTAAFRGARGCVLRCRGVACRWCRWSSIRTRLDA